MVMNHLLMIPRRRAANGLTPSFFGDWETGPESSTGIVDLISTGAFPANGSTISFNFVDANAVDRTAELETVVVGSTVRFQSTDGYVTMILTSGDYSFGTYDYVSGSYGTPTSGVMVTVSFFLPPIDNAITDSLDDTPILDSIDDTVITDSEA